MLSDSLFITSAVRLELLYSARGPADYAALADDLASLPEVAVDVEITARAEEVQALTEPKLLIAPDLKEIEL